jgi:Kelch motif
VVNDLLKTGTPGRAAVLTATLLVGIAVSALVVHLSGSWTSHGETPQAARAARAATRPVSQHVVVRTAQLPWRLPSPVSRMIALPDHGSPLLAGGLSSLDTSTNRVARLNLRTGREHLLGTVPDAFHDAAAATIHGHAVVFGGGSATSTDTVQSFPESAPRIGSVIGRLPQPRSDLSSVTIHGKVYLLGGYTGASALSDVLETSNGTSFTVVAHLPATVRYSAVASVGSTIWVLGGEHGNRPVRAIQRIDTRTGKSAVVGLLPRARSEASAMVIAGRVLIAGGRARNGHAMRTVDELDPAGHGVRNVARLPTAVADAAGVVIGGTAYLIGGEATVPVNVVQSITVSTVPGRADSPPA